MLLQMITAEEMYWTLMTIHGEILDIPAPLQSILCSSPWESVKSCRLRNGRICMLLYDNSDSFQAQLLLIDEKC